MALGWAPWAIRRAAQVCLKSWMRRLLGRPSARTAGCQMRRRKLEFLRSPPEFEASEWLHHLLLADLIVYAGIREKILEGGIGGPTPWPEAWVSIHRRDDPLIKTGTPE